MVGSKKLNRKMKRLKEKTKRKKCVDYSLFLLSKNKNFKDSIYYNIIEDCFFEICGVYDVEHLKHGAYTQSKKYSNMVIDEIFKFILKLPQSLDLNNFNKNGYKIENWKNHLTVETSQLFPPITHKYIFNKKGCGKTKIILTFISRKTKHEIFDISIKIVTSKGISPSSKWSTINTTEYNINNEFFENILDIYEKFLFKNGICIKI